MWGPSVQCTEASRSSFHRKETIARTTSVADINEDMKDSANLEAAQQRIKTPANIESY